MVTIAIGDKYKAAWEQYCRPSWQSYAARHGYDVIIITDYLDQGPLARKRSPHWQKLLILHHPAIQKYKRVVWLDSDIVINFVTAPCIVGFCGDPSRVGVVLFVENENGNDALRLAVNRRQVTGGQTLNQGGRTFRDVYNHIGFRTEQNKGFNAGVMVLSPSSHKAVFEQVYAGYNETNGSWFENGPLSYHLVVNDLVSPIPEAFNVNVPHLLYCHYPFILDGQIPELKPVVTRTIIENGWFLHFLGGGMARRLLEYAAGQLA